MVNLKIIVILISLINLLITNAYVVNQNNDLNFYKGNNPNNYLIFNDEMWRIIAYEDDLIKVIRNESIGNIAFGKDNQFSHSSIKTYLNNVYYENISEKDEIVFHSFNVGDAMPGTKATLNESFKNEEKKKWQGYVGLISISEYIRAYENSCDMNMFISEKCSNNYLDNLKFKSDVHMAWTITPDTSSSNIIYHFGNTYFGDSFSNYKNLDIFPVIYLKYSNLKGDGSFNNPFKIELKLTSSTS